MELGIDLILESVTIEGPSALLPDMPFTDP